MERAGNATSPVHAYIHGFVEFCDGVVIDGELVDVDIVLHQIGHDLLLESDELVFGYRVGFGDDWYYVDFFVEVLHHEQIERLE